MEEGKVSEEAVLKEKCYLGRVRGLFYMEEGKVSGNNGLKRGMVLQVRGLFFMEKEQVSEMILKDGWYLVRVRGLFYMKKERLQNKWP